MSCELAGWLYIAQGILRQIPRRLVFVTLAAEMRCQVKETLKRPRLTNFLTCAIYYLQENSSALCMFCRVHLISTLGA